MSMYYGYVKKKCFSRLPPQIMQDPPKEVDGPFKLDSEFMEELDKMKPSFTTPKLQEFDLNFLDEPINIPTREEAKAR